MTKRKTSRNRKPSVPRTGDRLIPDASSNHKARIWPHGTENGLTFPPKLLKAAAWLLVASIVAIFQLRAVTPEQILLNSAIKVPYSGWELPASTQYTLFPLLYFALHFWVMSRLALLAQVSRRGISPAVATRGNGYLRDIEGILISISAIGRKKGGRTLTSQIYAAIAFTTAIVLPAYVLWLFQETFLPFHDMSITMFHRVLLAADTLISLYFWIRFRHGRLSHLFSPSWRTPPRIGSSLGAAATRSGYTLLVALYVIAISWLSWIETSVPNEFLYKYRLLNLPTSIDLKHLQESGSTRLEGHVIRGRVLSGADFKGVDLKGVTFIDVNLSNANFDDSNLVGSRFIHVHGKNVSFRQAHMVAASIKNSSLFAPSFWGADMRGMLIENSSLLAANMIFANMAVSKFLNVELVGAHLNGAQAELSYLQNTDLRVADFSDARMQGVVFYNSSIDASTISRAFIWSSCLINSSFSAVYGVHVDHTDEFLDRAGEPVAFDNWLEGALADSDPRIRDRAMRRMRSLGNTCSAHSSRRVQWLGRTETMLANVPGLSRFDPVNLGKIIDNLMCQNDRVANQLDPKLARAIIGVGRGHEKLSAWNVPEVWWRVGPHGVRATMVRLFNTTTTPDRNAGPCEMAPYLTIRDRARMEVIENSMHRFISKYGAALGGVPRDYPVTLRSIGHSGRTFIQFATTSAIYDAMLKRAKWRNSRKTE